MEDIFLKDLGKSIKNLRKQNGMTQDALGELADICPKFLGEIERGDTNPSVVVVYKIAHALKRTPSDIFAVESSIISKKEYYLKKICALLRDKDEVFLCNVLQAMELLLGNRGDRGSQR